MCTAGYKKGMSERTAHLRGGHQAQTLLMAHRAPEHSYCFAQACASADRVPARYVAEEAESPPMEEQ
jgi:hypothetical protein